jgi:hypothetical protein
MASTNEETKMPPKEDDDSDVEMEGMDLDDDENEQVDDSNEEEDAADDAAAVDETLEAEDDEEVEEAHKEQQELMAAEAKKIAAPETKSANVAEQLEYLLNQSEVFAHFMAGTYRNIFVYIIK